MVPRCQQSSCLKLGARLKRGVLQPSNHRESACNSQVKHRPLRILQRSCPSFSCNWKTKPPGLRNLRTNRPWAQERNTSWVSEAMPSASGPAILLCDTVRLLDFVKPRQKPRCAAEYSLKLGWSATGVSALVSYRHGELQSFLRCWLRDG